MTTATATKPAAKSKASSNGHITGVQHRVLVAMSKAKKPVDRNKIKEIAFNGNSVNLKPVLEPLAEAKLIKSKIAKIDGAGDKVIEETFFELTAAGTKAASKPAPMTARNGADHQSLPKVGGTITKSYNGKDHVVTVTAEGFKYGKETYKSLTATAKAVRGSDQEVNGWLFFGLTKPKAE